MSTLETLLVPTPPQSKITDKKELFNHLNSTYNFQQALLSIKNDSLVDNYDFSVLGPSGMTPTNQSDGDDAEFMDNWFVVGSSQANYNLTPTDYPNNSPIITPSNYFVNVNVSDYSGSGLYFYQRQSGSSALRKLQQSYLTLGLYAKNNGSKQISLGFNLYLYLDPSSISYPSGKIWLQPGMNKLIATVRTDSLQNMTVNSGSYIEWRLNFYDLDNSNCDFDMYLYKSEYGNIHTSNAGSS